MLDLIQADGKMVYAVGKIHDIFNAKGDHGIGAHGQQ